MDAMRDAFMEIAWRDFIMFASANPGMQAAFKADTGFDLTERKTGIDAAIDEATGYDTDKLECFILWATEKHWGMEYAPPSYRAYVSTPSTPEGE